MHYSSPGLPSDLFPFLSVKNICIFISPLHGYISFATHHSWFDHPHYTWWTVLMLKLLSLQFSPFFLGPNKLCRAMKRDLCGSVCSQQFCMGGGILCQETSTGAWVMWNPIQRASGGDWADQVWCVDATQTDIANVPEYEVWILLEVYHL